MEILKLLTPSELDQFRHEVGGKTHSLKRLQDASMNVPDFRAIPSSTVVTLMEKDGAWNESRSRELADTIIKTFPQSLYAVRSSALIEDGATHAYAGQFMTKIHQTPDQLSQALKEVITQAHRFLQGNLAQFSVIVQEYIEADYAGITFTRNPLGGREMVIEYHEGIGEEIVGGTVKPEKYALYANQEPKNILPGVSSAISNFKKIEELEKFPQDIEWCLRDQTWYFLQARPITTLKKNDYEQSLYLDSFLKNRNKNDQKYIFEKTEISEIAPRPTPITLEILHRIYDENGPVQNVYRQYGITYTPYNFLEIIGNELFVNRELEIATLLPSYSYLVNPDYKPKFAHLRGAWRTLVNMLQLQRITIQDPPKLLEKLINAFRNFVPSTASIDGFMRDYEIIFEINLLAQKALNKLQFAMQKEPISPAAALTLKLDNEVSLSLPDGIIDLQSLQGNALEILDTTEFVAMNIAFPEAHVSPDVQAWYEKIPSWKKSYLAPIIETAKAYSALREYGRWLTVVHISGIRKNTSPEILHEWKGKEGYLTFNAYDLPARLTDRYVAETRELQGVSAGTATGVLVDREGLRAIKDPKKDLILYTKILSPDLTEHFSSIRGILSEDGGLLSHLAIMAREYGIPVIINVDLSQVDLKFGDMVVMDGSTGSCIKKPIS